MPSARGLTRPLITGRRFVIHGLSRLTVRVARLLAEEGAQVVVIADEADRERAPLVEDVAQVVWSSGDHERAFLDAGLLEAQALLILGDEDLVNLQAAVIANAMSLATPVVLRIFNPVLAEQFESGMNVRRAYSVSALAAPAIVATALGEEVLGTTHLGDDEVALCRVTVNRGSPLAGRTTDQLEHDFHLSLLARSGGEDRWESATGGEVIRADDRILVGGPIQEVLRLAVRDHTLFGRRRQSSRLKVRLDRAERKRRRRSTLLPVAAAGLAVVLLVAAAIFVSFHGFGVIEGLYFTVTTAFGEQTLADEPSWLKLVGIVTAVAGGALAAVLFSHLASVATAERLEERAGKRAARLAGHIVVAGLGTVGYRVMSLLADLEIPAVAVERSSDNRFRDALGERAPVLSGDVRLPENLERARVAHASCLLACTDDDLANVLACLHARRANPGIRTVARIFDEALADRVAGAFGIDVAISATRVAAPAFASAALDERAARPFDMGDVRQVMLLEEFEEPVTPTDIRSWEGEGMHLLAFRRGQGGARPPSALIGPLQTGDSAILAGPESVVRRILLGE